MLIIESGAGGHMNASYTGSVERPEFVLTAIAAMEKGVESHREMRRTCLSRGPASWHEPASEPLKLGLIGCTMEAAASL